MKARSYSLEGEEFILEQVSQLAVKVQYREQTGYFGLRKEWNPSRPFGWIPIPASHRDPGQGIESPWGFCDNPDQALDELCRRLLKQQREADTQRVNPEERMAAAQNVLAELMQELPETELPETELPETEIPETEPAEKPEVSPEKIQKETQGTATKPPAPTPRDGQAWRNLPTGRPWPKPTSPLPNPGRRSPLTSRNTRGYPNPSMEMHC